MEIRRMAAAVAAAAFFSGVVPAEAGWTYTETNTVESGTSKGYLTDGVWTFGAERAKNTKNLSANGKNGTCTATEPCSIDFTTIEGGYVVVEFSTLSAYGGAKDSALYESREFVSEFIAPDCAAINGVGCFKGCVNLKKVVLKDNAKVVHGGAFQDCSSLSELYPRTFSSVGTIGFSGCSSLAGRIEITSATVVDGSMFANCHLLEEVVMPQATQVSQYAFQNCRSLTNIVLASSIAKISIYPFSGCWKLSNETILSILSSQFTDFGHPSGDAGGVFNECYGLTGPLVWDQTTLARNRVPSDSFESCTNLSEVVIKTPVDGICADAFHNIKNGAAVYVPAQVPTTYGTRAIATDAAPFPRVYLQDNYDDWLDVMYKSNNHLVRKEQFNDTSWVSRNHKGVTWTIAKRLMLTDTSMCYEKADKTVGVLDKNILAFIIYDNGKAGTWVLRMPKIGLSVIVR